MKCLEYKGDDLSRIGEVIRTNEHVARRKVASGDWSFCMKEVWKEHRKWSKEHARNLDGDH